MPLGPTDFFWIGLVPCVLAAGALWLTARLGLRATASWALAVGGAIFLGMTLQHVRIGVPTAIDKLLHPRVGLDWLPWLVLVAALVTALAAYAPRTWQRWLVALAGAFSMVVPLRLLASNAAAMSRWSIGEKLGVLAFWSFVFAALWTALALGRRNGQSVVRSVLLFSTAGGVALTLAASHSLTLGEHAGIVAATLFGAIAAAWWTSCLDPGPSPAAGPLAVALVGLILLGYTYDLTATNAALLTLALAASAGWLPQSWPRQQITRAALRTALALLPLALAAGLAVATALEDPYG